MFKLATHGVAIKITSDTEITKVIISYSLASLHTHSRERMCWWLALFRKNILVW